MQQRDQVIGILGQRELARFWENPSIRAAWNQWNGTVEWNGILELALTIFVSLGYFPALQIFLKDVV